MESLNALVARFCAPDEPPLLERHRLGGARASPQSFARLVLDYLGTECATVRELAAVLDQLVDEDDLAWWQVAEGLLVSSASDGFWVLFTEAADEA